MSGGYFAFTRGLSGDAENGLGAEHKPVEYGNYVTCSFLGHSSSNYLPQFSQVSRHVGSRVKPRMKHNPDEFVPAQSLSGQH